MCVCVTVPLKSFSHLETILGHNLGSHGCPAGRRCAKCIQRRRSRGRFLQRWRGSNRYASASRRPLYHDLFFFFISHAWETGPESSSARCPFLRSWSARLKSTVNDIFTSKTDVVLQFFFVVCQLPQEVVMQLCD